MGKAARIKEQHKQEEAVVLNTISINLLSNGSVNVSGPINNPIVVMDVFSKAFSALAQYYAQQADNASPIVRPNPGIIVPN